MIDMEFDNYIPNSWVDDSGIRHAVIWDEDIMIRYKFEDGQLVETGVF